MSAIFGIIRQQEQPSDQFQLDKIQQAIHHRATDGSSVWQEENAVLGCHTLIVNARQLSESVPARLGDWVITADCRIDNREHLFSLLSLDKHEWENQGDAVLILKAWERWQEKCVDYLEGEFAFAIWDIVKQLIFLATDPIGIRPLYYYQDTHQFIFCSEIKGVAAAIPGGSVFNESHLITYFYRQGVSTDTYLKNVFALCGGNTLTYTGKKLQLKQYWSLQPREKYSFKKPEEWTDCLRHLLFEAVEKRLNPDLPVGITLSGGLDSSSVACIVAKLLAKKNKPLYAFSSVLPENYSGSEQDERTYIALVNRHCPNIQQTFVEATGEGPFTNVISAFETDEVFPNPYFYMDQAILKAAAEKNIRSLFTGMGGDFLLSTWSDTILYELISKGNFRQAVHLVNQIARNRQKSPISILYTDYLAHIPLYQNLKKWIRPISALPEQDSGLLKSFTSTYSIEGYKKNSDFRQIMFDLINQGHLSRLSGVFQTRNSYYKMQSCDIVFDKAINEFLADIPLSLFAFNGYRRGLLRYAMEGVLPKEIQWRRDKCPYSPDFYTRLQQSLPIAKELINNKMYHNIFEKYIDRNHLVNQIGVINGENIEKRIGFEPITNFNMCIISTIVLKRIDEMLI